MKTKSAVAVSFLKNPLKNQKFDLRELRIIRGGRATTMKEMQFNDDFPALLMEEI